MESTSKTTKTGRQLLAFLSASVTLAIATFVSASTSTQVKSLDPLVVPRTAHAATVLTDGQILITGGRDSDGNIVAVTEIFDPATETSTDSAALNTPRVDHSATRLSDGRVLVAGGSDGNGLLDSAEIFDPSNPEAGFRVVTATMFAARVGHTATLLSSGKVLFAGGDDAGTAEIFDPTNETFSPTLWAMTQPRSGHTATLLTDDSVLLAGGGSDSMELFAPVDQTFTLETAHMSFARAGHWALGLSDTRLLFFEGDTGNTVDEYNPVTGTVTLKDTLDVHASSVTLLANGRVLVLGSDVAGLYDANVVPPKSPFTAFDETSVPNSSILPRVGQTATELSGHKSILIAGGVNAANEFVSPALFNPASIWTDKDDYQPDEPVILSGSGWKSSEDVYLFAVDNETEQWTYEMTTPADANGEFVLDPYFIVELRHLGVQFHVTALGAQSTMQADVYFTDTTNITTATATTKESTCATVTTTFTQGQTVCGSVTVTGVAGGGGAGSFFIVWFNPSNVIDHATPETVPATVPTTFTDSFNTTGKPTGTWTVHACKVATCGTGGNDVASATFTLNASPTPTPTPTPAPTATPTPAPTATPTPTPTPTPATTLTVAPASGTYGGSVTLSATLTSGASGVSGKTINFTLNGNPAGSGVTNGSGVATSTTSVTLCGASYNVGTYPAGAAASFAGDGSFTGSSGNASLTVGKANATVVVTPYTVTYDGNSHTATVTSITGVCGETGATVGTVDVSGTTHIMATGSPYSDTWTFTGAANYNNIAATPITDTINKKPASVTPNAASKTYGDADPALTGTLTGFVASDGITATYSRTTGETVAGSPYTISATLSPASELGNYDITYNTANFTINAKAASVTPNAASKTYGDADPAFTGTLTGFSAADGVTATYSRTTGETVAGSPYTISATLSPAGVLGNYNITYNTANFTINKKTASVTPNAASKTYGDADPAFTGTVTGFLAADGVTATYSRTAGETVAGSPYTISATLSPAGALGNYDITYNTADFTINKKTASVTPNAASKTYGDADPAFTGTLTGFLAADGVTATYSRAPGETVAGSPYAISATLSPAGVLGNYDITYNTANFTINKKTASVTPNAGSKTYGDADPAFTGTLTGFLAADGVTATYSRTPGDTVAGSPYTISATLSPAGVLGNYDITYNTAEFTINKKDASVTPNAASKTYGDADPALTGTLVGFVAADGVTATYSRAPGETVAGSPYTISATLSPAGVLGNYNITYNTANFTIDKRTASVTPDPATKIYGNADPAFTGTLNGFVAADGVTATYTRTTGETVAGSPYTISATLSPAGVLGNYDITYNTAAFTITPRPASVTPDPASKIYGDADPAFTGTLNGFVAADGVTATYTRTTGETVAGSPYTISATLSPAGVLGNYSITYNTAAFTITPRPASVTPDPAAKIYGDADPAFTGTLNGFVAADGVTASYTRTAGETVAGSPYTISATLSPAGVLGNYSITYNTAAFTITPRPASVTPDPAAKIYGDADPAFTGTLNGFVAADGVTASYTRTAGETVAGSPYTISATLSPAGVLGNYTITYNTAAFTITPRPASVTPDPAAKIYGDADPAFTGTLSGFVAADGVTASYTRTAGETVAGSPYTISATLSPAGVLGNYTITYNTAAFNITPRPASVTPDAASKVYGDADPVFTGVLSGFVAADGVTASYTRTAGETVGGSPYTISATLSPAGVLGNYSITYNTAAFNITPRPASVTPDAASKVYGDADPALTGVLSGFVAADGVTATYSRVAGETVASSPYTISATLSPAGVLGNYNITYNTADFTITAKPASVTPDPASKVYGDADPAFTGTLNGFLAADGVTATYSRTTGETVLGSPYTISATLSPASVLSNYSITYNTANFTITAKAASVTPNPASKVYGSADPAFTGTLSGFLAADGVTATYSRTTGETVLGSPYTISATLSPTGVLSNYNITYNTAAFTITTKPASVTPNGASKTYGDADPAFTGTLVGFLAADGVTATYSRTAGETVAGSPYTISATLSPAGVLSNYSITYNTAVFTINLRNATWTTNPNSKTYGAADPIPLTTGSGSNFVAADGVTATYSRAAGETVLGGPYHITATLSPAGVLANYNITNNGANFTINPATLTITATNRTKVFGATYAPDTTPPSVDFTVTGTLYFGDMVTSITLTCPGYPSSALPGSPYTVTPSAAVGTGLSNYTISYVNGQLTIGYGTCTGGTPGGVILPPINANGSSVWKVGSTVPVKFTVCDATGNPISDPNAVFATGFGSITLLSAVRGTIDNVNEATYTDVPDVAFRWSGGQWIFNMATSNLTKNTTYTYRINLKDGSYIQFSAGTK